MVYIHIFFILRKVKLLSLILESAYIGTSFYSHKPQVSGSMFTDFAIRLPISPPPQTRPYTFAHTYKRGAASRGGKISTHAPLLISHYDFLWENQSNNAELWLTCDRLPPLPRPAQRKLLVMIRIRIVIS